MTEDEARSRALSLIPRNAEPVSLSDLENYLAKAADLLRGAIDQADFKAFIFPLLFFKRISDVYLEEYGQALEESGGDHEFAAFAENHRFQIPEGRLWEDVRARTEDIGQALVNAFRAIEAANQDTLYGIFGNAPWTNKDKLPDARLRDLIEHFSTKALTNAAVPPDVLGQAYEYLIKRFADQSNKKAGEYYTPRQVVRLLVDILDPGEGETVYDPACGTGGMLLEVVQHVRERGGDVKTLWGKLYGQEKVLTTSGIARMNMLLHGIEDFHIVRGDTLREPAFFTEGRLAQFDIVIANPPFSLKKWGREGWASDPYGRNALGGVPPAAYADWAWVQHMLVSAKPRTGRVAVVLPQGALFRGKAEARIREHILRADKIEAVIGLAPNLFYGTPFATCVLVLRPTKSKRTAGKVLVINGENLFKRGRNQNTLEPEHAETILKAYQGFADIPGLARVVTLKDIEAHGFNLSIPLYVEPVGDEHTSTLAEAIANLEAAHAKARETRAALERELAKWGFGAEGGVA